MKQNLEDYIVTFKNALPDDLNRKSLFHFENKVFKENTFTNPISGNETSLSNNEPWVIHEYNNEELNDFIWNCINEYFKYLDFKWFDSWSGFTLPRINKYENNQNMAPHCDRIKSIFTGDKKGDPTLSVLGLFDTEFEGGDLIMLEDKRYNFEPKDVMIFPSNFLYPHHVEPVTAGTRISFVSWTW